MREGQCAIAIMAKASLVGTVKTRLVPPLTYEEAAELNTCCLADTAANIVSAARTVPIQGFAAYHPPGSEPFFEDLLPDGFELLPPKEPTIGRSLFHAANTLVGHRNGGVAQASIIACACFGAISGSSVATAATMSAAPPPMTASSRCC